VASFLGHCDGAYAGRWATPAERLAAEVRALGEPIPSPRQLQNVFASVSAMRAGADYLLSCD
jgi:hypothetical protein